MAENKKIVKETLPAERTILKLGDASVQATITDLSDPNDRSTVTVRMTFSEKLPKEVQEKIITAINKAVDDLIQAIV